MSMSDPRVIFGVHSFSPYSRTDGTPYGMLRVLESSSIALSAQLVELFGGSSKFSWAAEDGQIKGEIDLKADEFPDFMFQLFLGKAPTAVTTPDTNGTISTAANKMGTSIIAATGLASVTIKSTSKADLKFGKYVIKATDTTHVDVYILSDIDIARGNAGTLQSDGLKVTASPLAISTGALVDVPNFGITLTGGASATAFVAGDTATFEVLPLSSKSSSVVIGSQSSLFPEFGALVLAQKRGNQEMFEVDCFRCKAAGMPLDFVKTAFAKAGVKATLLYDSVQDGVFKMRTISPS